MSFSTLGCERGVATLHYSAICICRQCCKLAYRCQRETDDDRAARRADHIRERLAWTPDILNGAGCKPKGMRWRTPERLAAEHNAFVHESLAGAMRRFGIKIDV